MPRRPLCDFNKQPFSKGTRDTMELTPITDADVPAVADFLHANYNECIPWARACSAVPWKVEAPNHGFVLRDGQRIVGALLAFYSERLAAERVERFCNLGLWCVLPAYRSHSIRLLMALLAQDGYHFTALSPNRATVPIYTRFKFRSLDTSAALIPNLPWPSLPGRTGTRISSDPHVIEGTLVARELELDHDHDHAQALAAHHVVLIRGHDSCCVMYRGIRPKGIPLAQIFHISNPELFQRAIIPLTRHLLTRHLLTRHLLTRHLLIRHRLLATIAELRSIGHRPPLSFKVTFLPKMYRSDGLEPDQIDDLYSELVCVPW